MILVSSCLLGNKVKYSGGSNDNGLLMRYSRYLTAVCPETAANLPIPRPPAELQHGDGMDVLKGTAKVVNKLGGDVTLHFIQGANKVLDMVKKHRVKVAILKANSPSCGNEMIYDGNFNGNKIAGEGVTAALLRQNGVRVFSEKDLNEDLLQRIIAMYREE
ncbi:DUF523 domain-containing protein [Anaerovibrio sp. JC8]|uniref:DUF523 domain-containing protein n=1 Tax=Anaerovibrio sp. JC8 TaxID=1240085 RepID=UPI000A1073C4|nr:DUF523 domain-containing protein [Anaerovibrio sp. JC8]